MRPVPEEFSRPPQTGEALAVRRAPEAVRGDTPFGPVRLRLRQVAPNNVIGGHRQGDVIPQTFVRRLPACQAQRGMEPWREPRVGSRTVLPKLEHGVLHQASDRIDRPPGVVLGERLDDLGEFDAAVHLFTFEELFGEERIDSRGSEKRQALRYVVRFGDHVALSRFICSRLRMA